MKTATAQHLLQSVRKAYSTIAPAFAQTRQQPWADFNFFKPYLIPNPTILDLGCANGRLITFLEQAYSQSTFQYWGLDHNPELLQLAQIEHPRAKFLLSEQSEIPLPDQSIDLVFSIAAFHHLPTPQLRRKALQEIHRVLKPSGYLFLTVWNLWQKKYFPYHLQAWRRTLQTLGDYTPQDLLIPWKNCQGKTLSKRYYHHFWPSQLRRLVRQSNLEIIQAHSVRSGEKVQLKQSHNYLLIARRHD